MKCINCLLLVLSFSLGASSQNWQQLGIGTNGEVREFYTDTIDKVLFIGGNFKYIGNPFVSDDTLAVNGIAKWDGTGYSTLASGQDFCDNYSCSPIFSISRFKDEIYCSTTVGSFSGVVAKGIAKWDGVNWHSVGEGLSQEFNQDGTAYCQLIHDDKLIVGGGFTLIGTDTVYGLASWDGANWHSLEFPALPSFYPFIFTMATYQGELYIAGNFQALIDGQVTSDVAKFDGTNWHEVGGGLKGTSAFATDLIVFNDELYISGNIEKSAGNAGNMIMKLQDGVWVDVAGGVSDEVHDMEVFNGGLYVGGGFNFVGENILASNIAKWTGDKWCSFGSVFNNRILTMGVLNDELFVGGGFTEIDGHPINYVAKWIGGDFVTACSEPLNSVEQNVNSENKIDLFISPNPATSTVRFQSKSDVPMQVSIYSAAGVEAMPPIEVGPLQSVEMDVSQLPKGAYWARAVSAGGVTSQVLIIQ